MNTLISPGIIQVLERVLNVKMSAIFLNCCNMQIVNQFESETKLTISPIIWINIFEENQFHYSKGTVSNIEAYVYLKYGRNKVAICWKSKSGCIYDIADADIDPTDIEFWLDGLDPKLCNWLMKPEWSLVTFPEALANMLKNDSGLTVSKDFLIAANTQLTPIFEKKVGYKVNKEVCISSMSKNDYRFVYEKGPISKLSINIYNNHNWNFVFLLWQSKSGKVYDVGDTDIDSNDIEFWIEGIDVAMYNRQMYPKATLPFKLKNLSYELVVTRLNIDCTITAIVKPEAADNREAIGKELTDFIETFNLASEAKDRKDGVIHSSLAKAEGENILLLEMDMGSAGAVFVKKLLTAMSTLNCFTKVEVG
jgi:hypothetical protein